MAIIRAFQGISPQLGEGVWLAENASILGDVELDEHVNIWYGAVLRGDVAKIRIGKHSNVQDLSCIHATTDKSKTVIGEYVTIGHTVTIHGAIVEDGALVGMGSILLDNARIGEGAFVGAGSLVTANTVIPPRCLALGRPAKVVRQLTDAEAEAGHKAAIKYVGLAAEHKKNPLL